MKKTILILVWILIAVFSYAQTPCLPIPSGIPATDEPPGCQLCKSYYIGNTSQYTPNALPTINACTNTLGSQWITATADASGVLRAELTLTDCDSMGGAKIAIFDTDLNLVTDCVSAALMQIPSAFVFSDTLTPLNDYHIMISRIVPLT